MPSKSKTGRFGWRQDKARAAAQPGVQTHKDSCPGHNTPASNFGARSAKLARGGHRERARNPHPFHRSRRVGDGGDDALHAFQVGRRSGAARCAQAVDTCSLRRAASIRRTFSTLPTRTRGPGRGAAPHHGASCHGHPESCPCTPISTGFELGSGLFVNTISAEAAAERPRMADVPYDLRGIGPATALWQTRLPALASSMFAPRGGLLDALQ